MKTDEAFALLTRENPVEEGDLSGPHSRDAQELKARIVLTEAAERPSRRRPFRLVARAAVVAALAAVVAFGALSVLPGNGPSAVARAAAVLEPSHGTILHTVVVGMRSDSAPSTRTETWQLDAPPYDRRSVMTSGPARRELATAGGRPQYYDARANTIHTTPPGVVLPRPGREGEERLVENLRSFLASGEAREDGKLTVDGRDAIRIVLIRSQTTLIVDADTYEPIESRMTSDDGIRVIDRFQTYERLPATDANLALLSLTAQHPGAQVEPNMVIEGVGSKAKAE